MALRVIADIAIGVELPMALPNGWLNMLMREHDEIVFFVGPGHDVHVRVPKSVCEFRLVANLTCPALFDGLGNVECIQLLEVINRCMDNDAAKIARIHRIEKGTPVDLSALAANDSARVVAEPIGVYVGGTALLDECFGVQLDGKSITCFSTDLLEIIRLLAAELRNREIPF